MAAPVLDVARRQLALYESDSVFLRRPLKPVTAEEMARYAAVVRGIEDILESVAPYSASDDPELPQLIEQANSLRALCARVLAVAGLDPSWNTQASEVLTLTERESVKVVRAFLNPPEPNEALRQAFKDYKAIVGL